MVPSLFALLIETSHINDLHLSLVDYNRDEELRTLVRDVTDLWSVDESAEYKALLLERIDDVLTVSFHTHRPLGTRLSYCRTTPTKTSLKTIQSPFS
jgi:hypothetical protein